MKSLDFIKIAIQDYKKVGAITISSKYAIRTILKALKPEYKYIVEYGAGSGVITKEILKILPSNGKIVALELNRSLFKKLSEIKDSRLVVLNADVVKVSKNLKKLDLPQIDAIISGIPFSFLKSSIRKEILNNTYGGIAKGGRFIAYQTSFLIVSAMKKIFKKVNSRLELRNIPPYFVMVGEK